MGAAWNRKVSDEKILESYKKFQSVWKVAKDVGLCGQSVHERLKKLNAIIPPRFFSAEEIEKIKSLYSNDDFKSGDGKLRKLCKELNRDLTTVVGKAKELGITNIKRKDSQQRLSFKSQMLKDWHKIHEHPRGFLGGTHTPEMKEAQSKRLKKFFKKLPAAKKREFIKKAILAKIEKYGNIVPGGNSKVTWKQGWREIGGKRIYARSRWEANYARYLQWLKERKEISDWEHEPKTFWFDKIKRGAVTYLPDFKVIKMDGSHFWVEVKGYMDPKSKTKISRFRRYFKDEKLEIKDAKWFQKNNRKLALIIKDWEKDRTKFVKELEDAAQKG